MKNLGKFGFYGLIISLALLTFSCNKNLSDAEMMDNEQQSLKQYLLKHNITVQPTSSGLYYLPTDSGTGVKPQPTDVVEFSYSLRLINDQVISTNIDSIAKKSGLSQTGVFYKPFKYRLSWWFPGLQEGFQLMHEGGKGTFIIPSNLAYGKYGYPALNIRSYNTVIFDISLIRVIHDPVAAEKAQIEKYILDSIPASKTINVNDSGVYHIPDIAGSGDSAVNGNTVTIQYIAKLLDGTVIEITTTPHIFFLGTDQLIPGIDQALRHMKKGESAWIIIPYKQAYGERPVYYINLPPFTTLVYYMTIVNIQ